MTEEIEVRNLSFKEENIGVFFPKSKVIFTWKFTLNSIPRIIRLEHSRLKGKRKLILDDKELVRYMKYTYNFSYSFSIDKYIIEINQTGQSYDLKIEGISFRKLLNQQKLERFNVIREEYIKEHPIDVMQKKKEEKDINNNEIREIQDMMNKIESKGLEQLEEIMEENNDSFEDEEDIEKKESKSERTIKKDENLFVLLGPENFNSEKESNVNLKVNEFSINKDNGDNVKSSISNMNSN